jgi:hypothetical protein
MQINTFASQRRAECKQIMVFLYGHTVYHGQLSYCWLAYKAFCSRRIPSLKIYHADAISIISFSPNQDGRLFKCRPFIDTL